VDQDQEAVCMWRIARGVFVGLLLFNLFVGCTAIVLH
jgi:hypothetical protein